LLRNNALIKEDAVGYTPLHYAAMGQFEIVEMLLDRGCDPEQRSYFNGKSSIDCALGYPAIIQMMQKVKSVIRPPDANIGSWIIAEPDHTPDRADRTDRTERSGGHTMSDDDASDDDASDDDSVLSVQDYFRKIFCF
jgi:ankyrin repeat protein